LQYFGNNPIDSAASRYQPAPLPLGNNPGSTLDHICEAIKTKPDHISGTAVCYLRLYVLLFFFFLSLADEKTACAAIGGLLKEVQKWNVVRCVAVCCTGNKCKTQNPTLPYPGSRGDFELISCLTQLPNVLPEG